MTKLKSHSQPTGSIPSLAKVATGAAVLLLGAAFVYQTTFIDESEKTVLEVQTPKHAQQKDSRTAANSSVQNSIPLPKGEETLYNALADQVQLELSTTGSEQNARGAFGTPRQETAPETHKKKELDTVLKETQSTFEIVITDESLSIDRVSASLKDNTLIIKVAIPKSEQDPLLSQIDLGYRVSLSSPAFLKRVPLSSPVLPESISITKKEKNVLITLRKDVEPQ